MHYDYDLCFGHLDDLSNALLSPRDFSLCTLIKLNALCLPPRLNLSGYDVNLTIVLMHLVIREAQMLYIFPLYLKFCIKI